jgi:flagellar biosynthesis anti-sigma factor FlgM
MKIPEKGVMLSPSARNESNEEPARVSAQPKTVARTTGDTDTVSLTEKGRELKTAAQHARLVPDIREDRVMRLKRQLEEGSYRVMGDRIAGNMIDESMENNTILKHIETRA